MDEGKHHQTQGPTEVEQLAEETADTPGHVRGKAGACCRAHREANFLLAAGPETGTLGCQPPRLPIASRLILSGHFTDEHSDAESG